MYINKFYNAFKTIVTYNKYKTYNKYNNRYLFYDIEKNKSYYICTLCAGSKVIKCVKCDEDINKKKICDKCDNIKIICDDCDDKGLKYYFMI